MQRLKSLGVLTMVCCIGVQAVALAGDEPLLDPARLREARDFIETVHGEWVALADMQLKRGQERVAQCEAAKGDCRYTKKLAGQLTAIRDYYVAEAQKAIQSRPHN